MRSRAARASTSLPVVLVTGATGFLGGALAAALLESPLRLYPLFLVRGRDHAQALERLRCSVERFAPSAAALAQLSAANVLCGELGNFRTLCEDAQVDRVTHVVHAAACVSFAWKREVWTTNVEETLLFAAALARLPCLQRFVHVSTAMVSGTASGRLVREEESPGAARQLTLYTKSKAHAESRLAELLGAKLVIARPSVIVGHSRLGCRASASIFWLFRMIHAARRVPFAPQCRIDIVPVDYCASGLMLLLSKPALANRCYHVSAGRTSLSFAQIDAAYRAACAEGVSEALRQFTSEELAAMPSRFRDWFGPCDPQQVAAAIKVYAAFASLDVTFDNARLCGEGASLPPAFSDYLARCIRTAGDEPIARQMQSEARQHGGQGAAKELRSL